ncbi:MAG: hypothetical protein ACREPT_13295 [Rudaea sp.]
MRNHTQFPLLAQHLQAAALAEPEPSADLWTRIAQAHARRRAQRIRARYISGALAAALLCALAILATRWHGGTAHGDENIDWQARAQALELQLAALDRTQTTADAGDVEGELAHVDRLLQAAYDHPVYTNELIPLWKRRSELLNTLIVARKQGLALTRI